MIPDHKPICDYRAPTCRICRRTFTSPAGNATVCHDQVCVVAARQQLAERKRKYARERWAKSRKPPNT